MMNKIIDATRDLVLSIEEQDVKGAKRRKSNSCAAAYALCRTQKFNEARVYKKVTYVRKLDGTWLRFMTPDDLYVEIIVFDRGGRMQTGEYKLLAPRGCKKLGAHYKPSGKRNKTGKVPTTPHIISSVRERAPKSLESFD